MESEMKTNTSERDRRVEERVQPGDLSVIWRQLFGHPAMGHLHDISISGASFTAAIPAARMPRAGQRIEIIQPGESDTEAYIVVRLHPEAGQQWLVGCHRDDAPSPVEVRVDVPSPPLKAMVRFPKNEKIDDVKIVEPAAA
jgi:hypothetical protein